MDSAKLENLLGRIADALERQAPKPPVPMDLNGADAFVWHAEGGLLEPVPTVNRVDMPLLKGVERQRDILFDNTRRFASGLPANNALLWGARGMGKSSLVKAAHASVNARPDVNGTLKLIDFGSVHVAGLAEAGLTDIVATGWNGMFAPAGTPPDVLQTVSRALIACVKRPEYIQKFTADGSEVGGKTPEEFAAYIRKEQARYREVIVKANIKVLD